MNRLRQLLQRKPEPSPHIIPLTEQDVDMSLRIFWTKIARGWDLTRIQTTKVRVLNITQQPDFEKNLIERRYPIDGLVDGSQQHQHSGASLLALLQVLDTLEQLSIQAQE